MLKKKVTIKKSNKVKESKLKKKSVVEKKVTIKPVKSKERYFESVGRRKTAVARVRIFVESNKQEQSFLINDKLLEKYFTTKELQQIALSPFKTMDCLDKFKVTVKLKGGGINAQAEAVRHGIARCLILFDLSFRKKLKKIGYLKRDPRMRERKKFGLKRARRAPQWSKR